MRIVFTAPFWSRAVNSICRGPIYLADQGHDILIITSQESDSLKGKVSAPKQEIVEGAEFFRPYANSKDFTWSPQLCWPEVREKIAGFEPDVIVGFGDLFYRLPLRISRHFNVSLVMFFEYLRLDKFSLPFRGGGKIRKLFPRLYCFCSSIFRRYLVKQCSAVMFSYYGDRALMSKIERYCPIVLYVPWCTETDDRADNVARDRKTGIYIGSLAAFKNAAELVEAIPVILDQSDTERFIVVGPGEYATHIKQLAGQYGHRLLYIESVPRSEAMRLLRSSGYGYTPVTDCGLGFIGDCWGTGTPLITTHELAGFIGNGIDTLVADGIQDLPGKINSILNSDEMFERLQTGGRERYKASYTAQAVGDEYLKVLREVVAASEGKK
jgi:glycosyltransferase involved in cell wall biosynthesis